MAPLTPEERDRYCDEAAEIAVALGARPDAVPRAWSANAEYLTFTYASGAVAVSPQARELAATVLAPPLAWAAGPLASMNRVVTLGLLPPPIREQYGWTWDARDEARLTGTLRRLRALRRVLPRRAAWWPEARRIV
ncbi:MAG: hypothetical protein A3I61_15875 [Acidobacteria bacterium RIFCSPLOWO2_02_FULL_68_18]|nr:MAG: hypothetical protein A3I61_15875 [Acidobacteria bacterium RIFCSPLOWO2_02_FULL_68_18]